MGESHWPTTSVRLVSALREPEDRVAWERFADEYAPALQSFCRRHGLQAADAEDIVQLVFVSTHHSVKRLEYSSDQGRFRSWLSTIALRAIWKLKERKRVRDGELKDPRELDRIEAAQQHLTEEINELVFQLAAKKVQTEFEVLSWQAFSLLWFEHGDPKTVAEQFDRPIAWVYRTKFNVLRRLKAVVRELADELDQF